MHYRNERRIELHPLQNEQQYMVHIFLQHQQLLVGNGKYSLILCNPPYKKKNSGEVNGKDKIAMCRHEITVTQEEIIEVASKKLKFGGRLCMCQRIERFTDLIVTLRNNGLEPKIIQFVTTDASKPPYLFLVNAVKGVKPQLKIPVNVINGV